MLNWGITITYESFFDTLNRLGFLLWSTLLIVWVLGFGSTIDANKIHHVGVFWLVGRVIWWIVLISIAVLASFRRIQNAGLNSWLAILSIIPYIGYVFWAILFFIPPKKKVTKKPN